MVGEMFIEINKRIQRCYKCKKFDHNKSNKRRPANVALTDMIEDDVGEALMDIGVEATTDGQDRQDTLDVEENASVEDLLYSDKEFF